jgi:tripartite-type tricarboxylate transporter receptor subunit TctC
VIITRRYFNALAATSAFMWSIAANRAIALAWPTRPVHLVVPFAAGGPTDVIARIVGERLSKGWGQQVLIENRPGGGTNIGVPPSAWPTRHTLLVSCAVA